MCRFTAEGNKSYHPRPLLKQEGGIQLLHQFIEEQLQHYLEIADELPIVTLPVEPLDTLFRDMLKTVWTPA